MSSITLSFNTFARRALTLGAMVALSPVFATVATAVYLDNRDSIFYTQERHGKNGNKIFIYKFRTMVNAPEDKLGTEYDSERLTKLGFLLRRSGLDELPQLYNIFKGDMNLVGPRPVKHKMPKGYQEVYDFTPGIISPKTGTQYRRIQPKQPDFDTRVRIGAQIEIDGMRNATPFNKLEYIYNAILLNMRENHCGSVYPTYKDGVHPRIRMNKLIAKSAEAPHPVN